MGGYRSLRGVKTAGLVNLPGFVLWYLLPLGMTFWYAFVENAFHHRFAGLGNFSAVMENQWFRLGSANLLLLGTCMVLAGTLLAMALALLLLRHPELTGISAVVLILPLLIPSVSAVAMWKLFFEVHSILRPLASRMALSTLFLWKTVGACTMLLVTDLRRVPGEILDAAALDGAGSFRRYVSVQLPIIGRTVLLCVILLLMFLLRVYKESWLLFGDAPGKKLYLLQHFMSQQFRLMRFQNVAAAAVILTAGSLFIYAVSMLILRTRRRGL